MIPQNQLLLQRFFDQLSRTPDAVACYERGVNGAECIWSYAELAHLANRVARDLKAAGIGRGHVVGVCLERGGALLSALLGIWKAGAAYVPLDPSYPADYVLSILEDAAPVRVLCTAQTQVILGDRADLGWRLTEGGSEETELESESWGGPTAEDLAYLMYTSGSTGAPKGVRVPHRQLVNWLTHLEQNWPFEADEVYAQKTSVAFAVSVKELFSGLVNGCAVAFIGTEEVRNSDALAAALRRYQVTRLNLVPSHLGSLLEVLQRQATGLPSLRFCITAGEPLAGDLVTRFRRLVPGARLLNNYGCTELNDICYYDTQRYEGEGFVPIGRPIGNTQVWIMDRAGRQVPEGVDGELHVASMGMSLGYHKKEDLTRERFRPNLDGEGLLYNTGDVVKRRSDGELEYLGRWDFQVKVRGYRVDVRQVEHALSRQAGIAAAAVMGHEDRLVAYCVGNVSGLRESLRQVLPDYLVPDTYILLAALPKLPNGKLNRRALVPALGPVYSGDTFVAPLGATERRLAEIWAEVLQIPVALIGRHTHFFEIGGHSLAAMRVIARIRDLLQVDTPLSHLFRHARLMALAEDVDKTSATSEPTASPIIAYSRMRPFSLSYEQQRMWILNRLGEGADRSYHIVLTLDMLGPLDAAALRSSFTTIVERHEILRTRYGLEQGQPVQYIYPPGELMLPLADVQESEVGTRIRAEYVKPFDLVTGPVYRLQLLRLHASRHLLLLTLHHIAVDGWSVNGILLDELQQLYTGYCFGHETRLPPLPIQYADYAQWQRQQDHTQALAYWKAQLRGYADSLALPADASVKMANAQRVESFIRRYPVAFSQRLQAFARDHDCTLFMVLLAALGVLVGRYSQRDDLCIGTTAGGRQRPELEGLIGFFINVLPLRLRPVDDHSVREYLAHVRQATLEGFDHQDVSFELILSVLSRRSEEGIPLVPVLLRHQNFPQTPSIPLPGGLTLMPWQEMANGKTLRLKMPAKSELDLAYYGDAEGLHVVAEYAADLFRRERIERLLDHHQQLLESMMADSSRRLAGLEWLSEAEKQRQLSLSRSEPVNI